MAVCPPAPTTLAPDGCPACGGGGGGSGCLIVTQATLCDQHPFPDAGDGLLVRFVRTYTHSCVTGAVTGFTDTALDGAPYTVLGTVSDCCADVVPTAIVPRVLAVSGIAGPVMVGNAPVVAMTIRVQAVGAPGSVTITAGLDVVTPVAGDIFEWSVLGDDDAFVGSVQLDLTDAGDRVIVSYSERV